MSTGTTAPEAPKSGGCAYLLGLPFAAGGLFAAFRAFRAAGQGGWALALFLGVFALLFTGMGVALLAGAASGRITLSMTGSAGPPVTPQSGEPWRLRKDWMRRRIEDGSRARMWGLLFFAGFWNLIAFPAAWFSLREMLNTRNYLLLFVLLFPLIGVVLGSAGVRAALQYQRYGVSVLELAEVPVWLGGKLAGVVVTRAVLPPDATVQLGLSCQHRIITGSGKSQSTRTETLWKQEQVVPGALQQGGTARIPFLFQVPEDQPEVDTRWPRDKTFWAVSARAEVPGVDFEASWEVPVFRRRSPPPPA